MVGLTSEQRRMLMDKLPDAGNLALGAFVFGQYLGDRPVSLPLVAFGFLGWLALFGWGLLLGHGERR